MRRLAVVVALVAVAVMAMGASVAWGDSLDVRALQRAANASSGRLVHVARSP